MSKEKYDLEIINIMIKLANNLDDLKLFKEADYLDEMIKRASDDKSEEELEDADEQSEKEMLKLYQKNREKLMRLESIGEVNQAWELATSFGRKIKLYHHFSAERSVERTSYGLVGKIKEQLLTTTTPGFYSSATGPHSIERPRPMIIINKGDIKRESMFYIRDISIYRYSWHDTFSHFEEEHIKEDDDYYLELKNSNKKILIYKAPELKAPSPYSYVKQKERRPSTNLEAILKEAYRRVGSGFSTAGYSSDDYRMMKFPDLNIIHDGSWSAIAHGIYVDENIVDKIRYPPDSYVPSWYSKFKSPIEYFEDQNSASYAETLGQAKSLDILFSELKDKYNLVFNY
tara:strand:- start:428 stop:1459 length:1032 start_codon:yes stop_codon:yes gene_type:complete